jgi:hypothetical protein
MSEDELSCPRCGLLWNEHTGWRGYGHTEDDQKPALDRAEMALFASRILEAFGLPPENPGPLSKAELERVVEQACKRLSPVTDVVANEVLSRIAPDVLQIAQIQHDIEHHPVMLRMSGEELDLLTKRLIHLSRRVSAIERKPSKRRKK